MEIKRLSMRFIHKCLEQNQFRLTKHTTLARLHRGITLDHLKQALCINTIAHNAISL